MDNIYFETERLILKTIDESFTSLVLDYYIRNREFLEKWEPVREEEFYTAEYHRNDLKGELDRIKNGQSLRLWILKKEDINNIIGNIGYSNIVRGCFQSCHLGYKLDRQNVNKGFITEALNTSIDYVFNKLKLHRIEANVIPDNYPSIRVLEKLGFYNEGISKKYLKINGKWQDHIHMVLLNEAMEEE
jgi:ribosomal-protein-alanine N-acetyltransferase